MSNSDSKIEEFKKLIRERGIAEATSTIDASGVVYSENFTESHVSDPIFSKPRFTSTKNSVDTKPLKLEFSGSETDSVLLENFDEKPIISSINLMSFISGINISVDIDTRIEMEQIEPIELQST